MTNEAPITHEEVTRLAAAFERSADWLDKGALAGPALDEQPKQPESSYVVSPVPTKMAPPALPIHHNSKDLA